MNEMLWGTFFPELDLISTLWGAPMGQLELWNL